MCLKQKDTCFYMENLKYNVENPFSNNDLLLFCSLSAAQEDLQGNSPAAPRGGVVSAARHSQNEGGEERLLWGTRPRFEASQRVFKSRSCSADVFLGLIFLSYPRILIMSNKLIKWFRFVTSNMTSWPRKCVDILYFKTYYEISLQEHVRCSLLFSLSHVSSLIGMFQFQFLSFLCFLVRPQKLKARARGLSADVRQIDLDVNRTYRDHIMFMHRYDVKYASPEPTSTFWRNVRRWTASDKTVQGLKALKRELTSK